MAFKPFEQALEADLRFASLGALGPQGFKRLRFVGHHAMVAELDLRGGAPSPVRAAFDRARSVLVYAWFDYELLVVAEGQALGAVEFALKERLANANELRQGGLGQLIDLARREAILPPASTQAFAVDPMDAVRHLRNALAHGNSEVHSPAMAFDVVGLCRSAIDFVFP